ncbi:uncharacterized protein BDZ99DRAFT_485673 [Mytilinidion resinicola]|uniref:TPR-like protein n=1 Tax=Mytilinidion resinicola TaxID=574789 RepID=A0A6A6Z2S3_9PEZI|nr:uncharacterized protein BDZ99DRAFT_485673 [Mytilinidion resinicola]KAF2815300.1 hypothetical protein BDZ99DRAFT_485673 [Mytilinidion resinicola]
MPADYYLGYARRMAWFSFAGDGCYSYAPRRHGDACCIDKSSSAELSEAINSMFSWYRRSTKCYVLLTDVSVHLENNDLDHRDSQLRRSRWFTRGWTLQELLAPPLVEFFSREGKPLGSKKSLERPLSEITAIPISALRGIPLSYFSIAERMSWRTKRETTREEDKVYSLFGMFDVHMPAIYGEGEHHALRRLQSEIEMHSKNPHFDKNSDLQPQVNQWIVPFERNIRLTDRESELAELHKALFSNNQFTKAAISGLGEGGKTQAFWIKDTMLLLGQFRIRDSGGKDVDIKKIVQDYLSEDSAGHWVLVFDNADDINMWPKLGTQQSVRLIDYIPRSKNGRVIFTTRDGKVGVKLASQNVIEAPKVTEDTATQMLRNFLIHKDLVDSRPADTKEMLAWLTYLPLAIAQAAAYINENGITLEDYLVLVSCQEQEIIELLTEEFEDDVRYSDMKNPVATIWLISFRQLQQRDPLAAEYMSFMACIDHKDVPQLLLPPGSSRKKEMDSIGTLSAYSFITRRSEDLALDMHRLVHLTVRSWLRNEGVLAEWTRKAVARLEEVFPDHEHRNRAVWRMYLPHARHALESNLVAKEDASRIDLEWKIAMCYYSDGRFDEAETFFREVMEYRKKVLGAEHPDTLKSIAKLALTHHAQSRFQESKALGLKAMEAQRRVLGEEDPETLSTMSHLAMTYSDLSQWKEAEELELQTMELRMRVLGGEHPDTLVGMRWWKKAEELGKQVITARKKVIGNLAHTYNNQSRYQDAEELLVQLPQPRPTGRERSAPGASSNGSQGAVGAGALLNFDEYGSSVIDIP